MGMPSRREGRQAIWDTHGIIVKRFCKSSRVFYSTLSTGIESMKFSYIRTSSDLAQKRKSSRDQENERIRILLLNDKKNNFALKSELRSISMKFKPILIEEVSRNWRGIIESQRREIDHTIASEWTIPTRSIYCFENDYRNKIGIFVKLISKSLYEMEEIEESSRVTSRWIVEKKIDRKSRHYWWTHGQDSGTAEWS